MDRSEVKKLMLEVFEESRELFREPKTPCARCDEAKDDVRLFRLICNYHAELCVACFNEGMSGLIGNMANEILCLESILKWKINTAKTATEVEAAFGKLSKKKSFSEEKAASWVDKG